MATTPQQGIMSLPETDEAAAPSIPLEEAYGAAKEGLSAANPQYGQMYEAEMASIMPMLMSLSDEQLDTLLQLIQYLNDHPEEYTQRVQELEAEGILETGDLPAEYDENFLAVFGAAILEAQRTNADTGAGTPAVQPPMQLAKGGIAEAARMVASQGRNGDTMLAHITKDEARMLRKHGGSGTINPVTGLPEFFLKKLWSGVKEAVKSVGSAVSGVVKSVGGAVKKALSSTAGKMIATVALAAFIGPAAFGLQGAAGVAAQYGLASAGVTALSGGSLKDVIKSGVTGAVTGYGGAALGPAIGPSLGVTGQVGQAALGAGLTSAGVGLATGSSIKDAVKNGLVSAALAGGMKAAETQGLARGTGTQDPTNVPVEDRFLSPAEAAQVNVNPQTGQVAGGAPVQPPVAQPALPSADPLGDFIQRNEAFRTAASTPVPAPQPTFFDKVKAGYDEFLSPTARAQAGNAAAMESVQKQFPGLTPEQIAMAPAGSPVAKAYSAAAPGVISNYGPLVGAGLGITALAGGFEPNRPALPQATQDRMSGKATQDLMRSNPRAYYTQNLPGVTYDEAGNITGSSSWAPSSGQGTTEVVSPAYVPFQRPAPVMNQMAAPLAPASSPYVSPLNFMPRYAAMGGMMEAPGGFPSTPLSTAPGPAMAGQSHMLPMNTPGVPMNLPMGYAMGGMPTAGIASLAVGGYPRRTGQISGPGTETSDDIPAMLSDGEFVMTAKAVRGLGKGSRREGAKKMYALMHRLEKNAARG